jgi:secondary thiamine-phosphate synthase enzyme
MAVRVWNTRIKVSTRGRGFHPLDSELRRALVDSGISSALLHGFLSHTSASLVISENADPDVQRDLETVLARLAPDGDPAYRHRLEGPDDMAAHVRSVLTLTEISLPVRDARLALGTWQSVYLWEHRHRGHRRTLEVTLHGE